MRNLSNVIDSQTFINKRRHDERKKRIIEEENKVPEKYKYDIEQFINFCRHTGQPEDEEALLDFLYVSVVNEKVKKTTWEKRLYAIKKYLSIQYKINIQSDSEISKDISMLRKIYEDEENKELNYLGGKRPVDKQELLEMIRRLPTREKAICIVNLITASRPSEMRKIKIADFDLPNRSLRFYLQKQKTWHEKRLTQECVKAVQDYIDEYNLKPHNHFVGRLNKKREYIDVEVSDSGYRYMLKEWIGLTPYNLRKTQVTAMHLAGADLPTVAKQTGHKSLETLSKHYLNVADSTVDKYL